MSIHVWGAAPCASTRSPTYAAVPSFHLQICSNGCRAPPTQQPKASSQVPKRQDAEGAPRGTATLSWRTLPHVCPQVSHLILSVMKHNPLLHIGNWHQLPTQGSQWSNLCRKGLLSMIEPTKNKPRDSCRAAVLRGRHCHLVSALQRGTSKVLVLGTKRGRDMARQGQHTGLLCRL